MISTEQKPVSHGLAIAALVGACALWGTSFPSVKTCGEIIMPFARPDTSVAFGPILLTALRFTIAAPLLLLFWSDNRSWRLQVSDLRPLLLVAVPMAAGFLLQSAGLAFTSATISGFITGLCVCVTPAFEWMLLGRRPTWRLLVGALLAIVGVALMTLTRGGSIHFGWGEILTLVCTLAFTLQIIYTGRGSEKLGAARLTYGSFVILAACGWVAALLISPGSILPAISGATQNWHFLLFFVLILFGATIGAQLLMNGFQRYVRPSEASIIYTTEPLFAAVFALILIGLDELPRGLGMAGAGMMIAANVLVALQPSAKSAEKKSA
ncbi:MAG: DMT family transporter [bacterium]